MKRFLAGIICALLLAGCAPSAFAVATAADRTAVQEVLEEGMTPLYAESLREGTWSVDVNCSSSMFRIEDCLLTVEDGSMTAELVMSSTSYLYVYPGAAEEAVAADAEAYIPQSELSDGRPGFVLPVSALDAPVACAAFSRSKELWYDRTLVFRSASLPLDAFAEGTLTTAESLGLADGTYTVEAALSGGSGRARVESPTELTVVNGVCTARVVWGSPNYDYMRVGDEQLFPVNTEGNSTFLVPVSVFDAPMAVVADTVAMGQPHEIAYTLTFDSQSLSPIGSAEAAGPITLAYAEQFTLDDRADGSVRLTVGGQEVYRLLPKGAPLPDDLLSKETPLYTPVERAYVASSSTMDLFRTLGALDRVRLTSTSRENWRLPAVQEAMDAGELLYAGKYSAPDFELVLSEDCDLVVENTMILHAPEIREKLEALGLPVFLDRSSYETHPLGRVEWIKLYGLLTGKTEEAEAFFAAQAEALAAVTAQQPSGKTAVFFYVSPSGVIVAQRPESYVGQMIALAGGEYVDLGYKGDASANANFNTQMEYFFAAAKDADVLIYNSTIDGEMDSIEQLLKKNALFAEFRAVRSGQVWCMEKDMFQQSSAAAEVIGELNRIFADKDAEDLDFLHKLT